MSVREKAKEIIAVGCGCHRECGDKMSVLDCSCLNEADAIRALVLEEAAKVAERMSDEWDTQWRANCKISQHVEGMSDGAHEVAAAIRALGEKE